MQEVEVLLNTHPKRNVGSAKRGESSETTSVKSINVVHMSSAFAPSLTTSIIFRCVGSHDRYTKRGIHLSMEKKKLVKFQGCSHNRNAGTEYAFTPQSD